MILHSNWRLPKKKDMLSTNREISEEELADRRIKTWASLSMRMASPKYKLRIPTSEELR